MFTKSAKLALIGFSFISLLSISPIASARGELAELDIPRFETIEHTYEFQGNEFSLLVTYKYPEKALHTYTELYRDQLHLAQINASFPPLSVESATEYKNYFMSIDFGNDANMQSLLDFLDIFENTAENNEIISKLDYFNSQVDTGLMSKNEAIVNAKMWVPTKSVNGNDGPFYATRNSGINLTAARNYAAKWATKINPKYGEERKLFGFGSSVDCTNFVSQILSAGGVAMVSYSDEAKGWWWKSKGNRSISWVNANVFKNYMGSGYKTKYWNSFVSNVRDGDFIGIDFGSDGVIDHMGFVYAKSGTRLRIAQHTTNYLDWNRNWPNYNGKGTYYRVRR